MSLHIFISNHPDSGAEKYKIHPVPTADAVMDRNYWIKDRSNQIALLLGMSVLNCLPFTAQAPPTTPPPVFRDNVRLVSVDIIVTDKNGVPLQNLKPEDFTVVENGRQQKILSIDSHPDTIYSVLNTKSQPNQLPGSKNKVTLDNSAAGSIVWNLILLDALDSPQDSQMQARKGVQEFIRTLPANEQFALAIMGTTLTLVVHFKAGAGAIDTLLKTAVL